MMGLEPTCNGFAIRAITILVTSTMTKSQKKIGVSVAGHPQAPLIKPRGSFQQLERCRSRLVLLLAITG